MAVASTEDGAPYARHERVEDDCAERAQRADDHAGQEEPGGLIVATSTIGTRAVPRDPGTGRYRLTEKGVALMPVLLEMMVWSAAYDPKTAASPAFVERICADREGLMATLRATLSTALQPST